MGWKHGEEECDRLKLNGFGTVYAADWSNDCRTVLQNYLYIQVLVSADIAPHLLNHLYRFMDDRHGALPIATPCKL